MDIKISYKIGLFFLLFSQLFFCEISAQEGYNWKEPVFMTNNIGNSAPHNSVIDANGNIFVTGVFKDEIVIQDTMLYSSMRLGIYLSKYDQEHQHLWSKLVMESKYENPNQIIAISGVQIEIDEDDFVYSIVHYSDSVLINGEFHVVDHSTQYFGDQVMIKYTNDGVLLNVDHIKGNCPTGISNLIFSENEIYFTLGISRHYLETLDSCTCVINSDTTKYAFENQLIITKMEDSVRVPTWKKPFNAQGSGMSLRHMDKKGDDMYLAGTVYTSVDLLYDNEQLNVPFSYKHYVFIMKIDLEGNKKWWGFAGVTGWDSHLQLVDFNVNTNNDILLSLNHGSQSTLNQIHFSDFSSLYGFGNNDESFAVVNYDSLGNIKWKDMSDSRGYETNGGLATDSEHNVYLTSTYIDSLYFGEDSLCSENIGNDQLITSYTKDGQKRWSTTISGPGTERGLQVLIDQEDDIHLFSAVSGSEIRLGGTIDKSVPSGSSFFLVKMEKQPLSIPDNSGSFNDINVYPNPNIGEFYIELNSSGEKARVELYNSLGQLVKVKHVSGSEIKFSNLESGLYFMKIKVDNSEIVNKIIVE